MTKVERASCINTIELLRRLALNVHGVIDVVDNQNCDKIIKMLNNPEPRWIPCSSRLPDDGAEVFVYLFNNPKSPYIAWIEDSRWYTEEFEVDKEHEPLAWMPLPEPWDGGDSE